MTRISQHSDYTITTPQGATMNPFNNDFRFAFYVEQTNENMYGIFAVGSADRALFDDMSFASAMAVCESMITLRPC